MTNNGRNEAGAPTAVDWKPGAGQSLVWSFIASFLVALWMGVTYWPGSENSAAARFSVVSSFAWVFLSIQLTAWAISTLLRSTWPTQRLALLMAVIVVCCLSSFALVNVLMLSLGLSGPGVITAENDSVILSAMSKMHRGIVAAVFLTPLVCFCRQLPRSTSGVCSAVGLTYAAYFLVLP